MQAVRLIARSFRNLADLELELPLSGAAFLGPNGHGKTSLLEAIYYPVLFRSLRQAADADVGRWESPGFAVALEVAGSRVQELGVQYSRVNRKRRITVDGTEIGRLAEAVGQWLAVAFLPTDLRLVQGPAAERRTYLDRVLSLADSGYLRALLRYRSALAQRNAALRQGRPDLARSFDGMLAGPGALVIRERIRWVEYTNSRFANECRTLGEAEAVSMRYRGDENLSEESAWAAALAAAQPRELLRSMTLVGPQRDDLVLELSGHDLREFGSTGQHRTAAIGLKLCELATLSERRGSEPALLLDDVFAELDPARQAGLAERLKHASRQVFVTSPRKDELPDDLDLPVCEVRDGRVLLSATVS
jgi:DNA replication and repair protein RecF